MRKSFKSWLSLVLCLALLAAAALSTVSLAETTTVEAQIDPEKPVILMTGTQEEPVELGEGELTILFEVIDAEGNESWFQIHTDAETVGDALKAHDLIQGAETDFGLMVQSVCGIEAIWSETAAKPQYWAFYINGEYAQTGVDSTPVEDGYTYLFKVE